MDFTGSLRSSPLHVVLETPRKHRKLPFAWFFLRQRYPLYSTDSLMDSYSPACCTSTFFFDIDAGFSFSQIVPASGGSLFRLVCEFEI